MSLTSSVNLDSDDARRYCDICARTSLDDNDRLLQYGGTFKESDGTLTCVCKDCFDGFCQLSQAERQREFPLTLTNFALLLLSNASDRATEMHWREDFCSAFRSVAASKEFICGENSVILDRYDANASEKLSLDAGVLRGLSRAQANGSITREQLRITYRFTAGGAVPQRPRDDGSLMICEYCRKQEPAPHAFSMCSRCRVTYYCGNDCQRVHWPTHKKTCVRAVSIKK